jgi:double-stranded uracil-DNA glycosylase
MHGGRLGVRRVAAGPAGAPCDDREVRRTPGAGPNRAELLACAGRTIDPVIAPGLRVLFCGINPGLYTAWTGHHFARPGNRFWPALHRSGFTPRQLHPSEQAELLDLGLGVTNVVERATATAAELTREELRDGGRRLEETAERYAPAYVALLGVTAYRAAFGEPRAGLGEQVRRLGRARLWVLPNPSGLNAHYTPAALAEVFGELRRAAEAGPDTERRPIDRKVCQ